MSGMWKDMIRSPTVLLQGGTRIAIRPPEHFLGSYRIAFAVAHAPAGRRATSAIKPVKFPERLLLGIVRRHGILDDFKDVGNLRGVLTGGRRRHDGCFFLSATGCVITSSECRSSGLVHLRANGG